MTVLCGLGAVELEGVGGGGRSGDVSVAVEAMASVRLMSLTRLRYRLSRTLHSFMIFFLTGVERVVLCHGELASMIMIAIEVGKSTSRAIPSCWHCLAKKFKLKINHPLTLAYPCKNTSVALRLILIGSFVLQGYKLH